MSRRPSVDWFAIGVEMGPGTRGDPVDEHRFVAVAARRFVEERTMPHMRRFWLRVLEAHGDPDLGAAAAGALAVVGLATMVSMVAGTDTGGATTIVAVVAVLAAPGVWFAHRSLTATSPLRRWRRMAEAAASDIAARQGTMLSAGLEPGADALVRYGLATSPPPVDLADLDDRLRRRIVTAPEDTESLLEIDLTTVDDAASFGRVADRLVPADELARLASTPGVRESAALIVATQKADVASWRGLRAMTHRARSRWSRRPGRSPGAGLLPEDLEALTAAVVSATPELDDGVVLGLVAGFPYPHAWVTGLVESDVEKAFGGGAGLRPAVRGRALVGVVGETVARPAASPSQRRLVHALRSERRARTRAHLITGLMDLAERPDADVDAFRLAGELRDVADDSIDADSPLTRRALWDEGSDG